MHPVYKNSNEQPAFSNELLLYRQSLQDFFILRSQQFMREGNLAFANKIHCQGQCCSIQFPHPVNERGCKLLFT